MVEFMPKHVTEFLAFYYCSSFIELLILFCKWNLL